MQGRPWVLTNCSFPHGPELFRAMLSLEKRCVSGVGQKLELMQFGKRNLRPPCSLYAFALFCPGLFLCFRIRQTSQSLIIPHTLPDQLRTSDLGALQFRSRFMQGASVKDRPPAKRLSVVQMTPLGPVRVFIFTFLGRG